MADMTLEKVTLEQVTAQVRKLTSDEQRQLLGLLGDWLAPPQRDWIPEQNELLLQGLKDAGLTVHRPTVTPDLERFRAYQPVTVQGRPVSETLLEERR